MPEDVTGDRRDAALVARVYYEERLWPSPGIWVIGTALAATAGVVFYPAAGLAGVSVALVVSGAILVAVMLWWSARIRVVEVAAQGVSQPWLQAGRARIPLAALGEATPLTPPQWSTALGTGADARSYRFVRGWIGSGVQVDVVDVRDPVPSWLLSSRRPGALVSALEAARSARR